ncbi:odorant receptor 10-like [Ptiloglossa arizonensis]|uniref:odorant receptor 10-like n=1 Tax=Ptiloglossa arizonensis TaxID=3350558 RepID=UPI003F9ECCB3
MRILRRIFTLLTICGCLRPSSWTSPSKKFLYNVYVICVMLVIHSFVLSQILDLVFIVDNQDDFSDNFYMTLAMIVTCFKMYGLLMTRENIDDLVDTLRSEPFMPMDIEETAIRTRFDKTADCLKGSGNFLFKICITSSTYIDRWNTKAYMILIESCIVWICTMSFFTDFGSRKLTFRAWLPFDYSSAVMFTFVYAHQAFSAAMCCLLNVACDSLFSGLLVHIYCQFEILGHRLRNIQRNEHNSVKQCARHHNHIYKFATMVNDEFKVIVFIQFLTSTSTVCFDLYRLTQKNKGSEIVEILFYASCTLMQIFYYCWYGNEVKMKSLEVRDMVFESDWTSLNNKTKKILIMIMTRAAVPIEFTSLYLVSVNLESFKVLLKTSYSAYNLLQHSQ